ncbi:MAG: putative quinol monooxygenase [Specibacter sp.]
MNHIELSGQLFCAGEDQLAAVEELLPRHIELTRAEPGCLSFEVEQTDDPFVWEVSERFMDAGSFERHQMRVKASEWGRATAGMKRNYSVTG